MTNTAIPLSNVKEYNSNLNIYTADGSALPITAVCDLSSSLANAFMSPNLYTNLISIGQFVDHNFDVYFSSSSYVV